MRETYDVLILRAYYGVAVIFVIRSLFDVLYILEQRIGIRIFLSITSIGPLTVEISFSLLQSFVKLVSNSVSLGINFFEVVYFYYFLAPFISFLF